ncbi:MAG: cupin domain-containing protein, partial [Firmicutes bacterium]|nr:cupin domain-containing protein [Bacillota bacterium]
TIAGQPHIVGTGEMIIMPANQPHALAALEQFKMLLIMIKS